MSLISEALKKAQRQRTAEVPGGEGTRVIIRRGSSPGAKQVIVIAGGIVFAVVAAAVAGFFMLRTSEEEIAARVALATAKAKSAPAAKNATGEPAGPTLPLASGPTGRTDALPPMVVLNLPPAAGSAAPIPVAPAPARPALVTPSPSAAETARGTSPNALQDYIDTLRITGWSAAPAPADSKVMINDKVYRINDVVDRALGLKLSGIQADRLTFTDERGTAWVRRL